MSACSTIHYWPEDPKFFRPFCKNISQLLMAWTGVNRNTSNYIKHSKMRLSNLGDDIIMITCCIIECEIAACQIMLKLNVNSIE